MGKHNHGYLLLPPIIEEHYTFNGIKVRLNILNGKHQLVGPFNNRTSKFWTKQFSSWWGTSWCPTNYISRLVVTYLLLLCLQPMLQLRFIFHISQLF